MAALLPDFNYDVFISYRHNDDRADGWVTEFVQRLEHELRAVMKEPVSVYFDKNPRDGLQEMHLVDSSLRERLRAAVLVPILSQTYCDAASFAWQHEFLVFKRAAGQDRFGLNVPLPGGAVASRILPLRVHDLDADDGATLARELGGHLRSVDFVYQQLGVNRPLRLKDDDLPGAPLLYRNQINKVANALKDVLRAMRAAEAARPAQRLAAAAPAPAAPAAPSGGVTSTHTVFLAWATKDLAARRDELALTFQRAGLRVVPATDCPPDEDEFRRQTAAALAGADCAVHMLGNEFGRRFEDDDDVSFPVYQYQAARTVADERADFRQFIWYCVREGEEAAGPKPAQQAFIRDIRNAITERTIFSNVASGVQLVDQIRQLLAGMVQAVPVAAKENDIFFVFNHIDHDEANALTDRLGLDVPLELLAIEPDSEDEYRALTVTQIPKSRLAVVYFKHGADWALPFVKQVWKMVGGAASTTPILLIGEDDPTTNRLRTFKAPNVLSQVLAHGRIPEEVKRVLRGLTQEGP